MSTVVIAPPLYLDCAACGETVGMDDILRDHPDECSGRPELLRLDAVGGRLVPVIEPAGIMAPADFRRIRAQIKEIVASTKPRA